MNGASSHLVSVNRRPSGEAVVGRDGKPRVVATLGPGDHFGETAMLEARKARNLTVRCVTASCVLRAMSMARFSEILRQRPELHFTVQRAAVLAGRASLFTPSGCEQVQRAAQMRTNQRIRNVVASAADEDLRVVSFAPGETIFRQGDRFVDTSVTLPRHFPRRDHLPAGRPVRLLLRARERRGGDVAGAASSQRRLM